MADDPAAPPIEDDSLPVVDKCSEKSSKLGGKQSSETAMTLEDERDQGITSEVQDNEASSFPQKPEATAATASHQSPPPRKLKYSFSSPVFEDSSRMLKREPSKSVLRASDTDLATSRTLKKRVSFGQMEVRKYPVMLGDNPSVSYGPPLTIGWEYQETVPMSVDLYEKEKPSESRRNRLEFLLGGITRLKVLQSANVTDREIELNRAQVSKIKRQRNTTLFLAEFPLVEGAIRNISKRFQQRFGKEKDQPCAQVVDDTSNGT